MLVPGFLVRGRFGLDLMRNLENGPDLPDDVFLKPKTMMTLINSCSINECAK